MSLQGIDTSKWQAGLPDATIKADFIILKATEGVGYVDPDCAASYAEAKAAGKLLGVYHFGRFDGNTPEAEAQFFYDNIKGYIGEAICVLDLEVDPATPDLAKRFLDTFYQLSGVHALIYLSLSRVNSADWSPVSVDYALWVARYWDMATDVNYDMTNAGPVPDANWANGYAMWQWTSTGRLDGYGGNLDCSIFYGDRYGWEAFARARVDTPIPAPTPPAEPTPPAVPAPDPTPTAPPVEGPSAPVEETPQAPPVVETPAKVGFWQLIGIIIIAIIKRLQGVK